MNRDFSKIADFHLNTSDVITKVGTWEWDLQTGKTIFDDHWAAIIGYKLEELQPTTIEVWQRLTNVDDLYKSNSELQRYLSNQTHIYESEVRMLHKSGKWVWILDRGKIVEYDLSGNPLKMVGSHYDVTTRKLLEEVTKSVEYKKMLESTPFPVLVICLKSSLVKFANNQAREGIILYQKADVKLKEHFVHPKQADLLLETLKKDKSIINFEVELYNSRREVYLASLSANVLEYEGENSAIIQIEDISERKRNEEKIRNMYLNDSLTGLKNKAALRLFEENINANNDLPSRFAVIYIDLDDFGNLSQKIGYYSIDSIIVQIAHKIEDLTGQDGTVFYYAGDEFVIVLKKSALPEITKYLEQLRRSISKQFLIDNKSYVLTASIGFEIVDKDQFGKDLLQNSKIALGVAKQNKNTYVQFTSELVQQLDRESTLEQDLRTSIINNELELYYQPIFNVVTGKIDQAEALLRWNHPTFGMVTPIEFIPIAERTKLILPITDWVIHETCTKLSSWDESKFGPLSISINLSFVTIFDRREELFEYIKNELAKSGINPKRLKLEVTESSLVQDSVEVIKVFIRLRELGLSLALDDFGTGYSSFAYLKMLPLDVVKIDRSLINSIEIDQRSLKIVEAMMAVLHGLNLDVTIEGVETLKQFELLSDFNPDNIQGYLFSKPLKLKDFKLYYHASKDRGFLPVNVNYFEDPSLKELWKKEWNSGNKIIDYQHQDLMIQLRDLSKLIESNKIDSVQTISQFDNLLIKISRHFKDETEILEESGYEYTGEHKAIHGKLQEKLTEDFKSFKSKKVSAQDFLNFIEINLFKQHFLEEDSKFFNYVSQLSSKFPLNYVETKYLEDKKVHDHGIGKREVYDDTINKLLLKIASEFIRTDKSNYSSLINKSLESIGIQFKADRAYIFKYNWAESTCSNTFEWCAPDITAQIDELQNISLSNISEWVNAHVVGETIFIPDVQRLDQDSQIRLILEPQGVQSLLTLPMIYNNSCYGFIGFDSVKEKHIYSKSELEILHDLSEIIMSALKEK